MSADADNSRWKTLQAIKNKPTDLSKTHPGQPLPQHLGSPQGFLVVVHGNAHHGGFDAGAGHQQDLPQSAANTERQRG